MIENDLGHYVESSLSRQLSWIAAADAKTSTVFAFSTVMLGVLAALVPSPTAWSTAPAVFTALSGLLLLAALLFSTFAAFPRTPDPRGSLVYFGGIAEMESEAFEEMLLEMETATYLKDLAKQCHRNAEIAKTKYAWVKRAMLVLYISALPWLLAVYHLYRQPA